MTSDQPIRPANIENIVAINQGKKPLTTEISRPRSLDVERFAGLADADHVVVDARSSAAFGAGHMPRAFNIQLESREFEQRVGWVTPPEAPILLLLEEDADADRALHALAFLGLDSRVEGYLAGGFDAWLGAGRPHVTLAQIGVRQLYDRLLDDGMRVLDVRGPAEFERGHIEAAHHMDYRLLRGRFDELPLAPHDEVSVICGAGLRSSTACSILLQNGFERVHNTTGGFTAWAAAGLPQSGSG